MMRFLISILLCLGGFQHARPGDLPVVWSGEMRVRGEVDGRDFNDRSPANAVALLRARLGALITPAENTGIVLQFQTARLFGQPTTTDDVVSAGPAVSNVELYQGYFTLSDVLIDGLSFSAGRIELSFGSKRIIGPSDWSNHGRSLDGAMATYQWAENRVDALFMNTVETQSSPDVATPFSLAATPEEGRSLCGVYAALIPAPDLRVDTYFFREWTQHQTFPGADDLSRFTGGARVKGSWESVGYEGEGAYQFGTRLGQDISSFMLSGQLGYSFSGFPIAVATVGYDYLSGTPLDDSRYRTFEAPYQSSHEQYGLMDYFKASPENTLGRGLQDAYLKLTCKPAEHLSITAWGHAFWLAQSLIGLWSLGEEADIVAAFEYDGHVTLELGAAGFLPEDLMRIQFNGSDVAWWGYSTVRVRF